MRRMSVDKKLRILKWYSACWQHCFAVTQAGFTRKLPTFHGMFCVHLRACSCVHLRACSVYIPGHVLCTLIRVNPHRQFATDSEFIEINSASEENDTLACWKNRIVRVDTVIFQTCLVCNVYSVIIRSKYNQCRVLQQHADAVATV